MEEITQAVEAYFTKWKAFIADPNKLFLTGLTPTAIGWKVEDRAELDMRFQALVDLSTQAHFGWVNDRWLITLFMKEELPWGVRVIKLMQRRPGSKDAVGLDHVDFFAPEVTEVQLGAANVKWTAETNGDTCKWLSVWFDDTEAKLRDDTVLEVCADELIDCQKVILRDLA